MSLHVDQANASLLVATTYPVLAVAYYSAARIQLDDALKESGPDWQARIKVPAWARRRPFSTLVTFVVNTADDAASPATEIVIDERLRLATDRIFNLVFPVGFLLSLVAVTFDARWALAAALVGVAWVAAVVLLYASQTAMIRLALKAQDASYEEKRLTVPRRRFWVLPNRRCAAESVQEIPFNYLVRATVTSWVLVGAAIVLAVFVAIAP